jgi:hypothetical protein
MKRYENLFRIVNKLHEINFRPETGLIQLEGFDRNSDDISVNNTEIYQLDEKNNKGHFKGIIGCCHICEDHGVNKPDAKKCADEKKDYNNGFQLQYVSHGSHTIDYLHASGLNNSEILKEYSENNWNHTPVLFLMENPSKDYDGYTKMDDTYKKYPSKSWYWIFRKRDSVKKTQENGDDFLKQGYYGDMIYSLICNNRLANAYITNAIKCGMNKRWTDKDGNLQDDYLGTWWYQNSCKELCGERVLAKEIEALAEGEDNIVVFAFGNNAYHFAKDFLQNSGNAVIKTLKHKQLILLPHPSSRINNQFRKVILKSYVHDVLTNRSIGCIDALPEFDDDTINKVVEILQENDVNCHLGRRNFKKGTASVTTQKETSVFGNKEFAKNVSLKTTNGMEYWYTFDDASFWVYDESQKKYIDDYESDKTFIAFKQAIDSVLLKSQ